MRGCNGNKLCIVCASLICITVASSVAASPSVRSRALPTDLASAAAAYDRAQINGDGRELARLLADDYELVNGANEISDKAGFIADSTATGFSIKPFVVENPINRTWANGAVLSGEVHLQGLSAGKPFQAHFRFADVWRKREGRWQVVFTEVTRFPNPMSK